MSNEEIKQLYEPNKETPTTWLEVKRYLRDGYKIAIEVNENLHVFAQKTDYIREVERNGTQNNWVYVNYDGDIEEMMISHIDKVIYHSPFRSFAPKED